MVGKVGIAGLGLIGGSLAKRLAGAGVDVVAWNHRPHPYEDARKVGITCVDTLEELAAAKPNVLILCNPLKVMPAILEALAPVLDRETTTLSDVGSVKAQVRAQVKAAGLADCYVGAHPMTGNEHSGFDAADAALYDGALWAVSVDDKTDYDRFLTVAQLIVDAVGDRIIVVDDAMHDRAAAMISHAPHAVATAMVNGLVASPERNVAVALAAGSWRDMTRVALTDPNRTRAMIKEDGTNVARLLRGLAASLNGFADSLEVGDEEAIADFFQAGQPFRDFKAVEKTQKEAEDFGEVQIRHIDKTNWQESLKALTQVGEHIVAFPARTEVEVQLRSAL